MFGFRQKKSATDWFEIGKPFCVDYFYTRSESSLRCLGYCQLRMWDTERVPINTPFDELPIQITRLPEYIYRGQIDLSPNPSKAELQSFSEDLLTSFGDLRVFRRERLEELKTEIENMDKLLSTAIQKSEIGLICERLKLRFAQPSPTCPRETWIRSD